MVIDMKKKKLYQKLKFIKKYQEIGTIYGKCKICGNPLLYYYKYDADCCITCNEWLSENCGDSNCPYCSIRPETPAKAYELDKVLLNIVEEEKKEYFIKKYEKRLMARKKESKKEIISQRLENKLNK